MPSEAIKSYTANSMHEALVMVRKDLGPEALIVAQESKGRKIVLKATLDEEIAAKPESLTPAARATPEPEELVLEDVVTLHREPRQAAELFTILEPAPDNLASRIQQLNYPLVAGTLEQLHGTYRFIGASGVGKTSLLMKILVEWVKVNDPADVLVVASDNHQLGAHEALQLICQLCDVEMICQSRSESASQHPGIARSSARRLVLVDTCAAELSQHHQSEVGIKDVLVVSAMHSLTALHGQLACFPGSPKQLLALTHVDQPFAAEELAEWLVVNSLKPGFITSSATLPGGVEVANKSTLMRLLGLTAA